MFLRVRYKINTKVFAPDAHALTVKAQSVDGSERKLVKGDLYHTGLSYKRGAETGNFMGFAASGATV